MWLRLVDRQDLIGKFDNAKALARSNYRICEQHFETNFIKFSKNHYKKYLTKNAYPTLNLPSIYDGASTGTSQYEAITAINNQINENIPACTSTSQYEGIIGIDNQNDENVPLAVDTREKNTVLTDQTSCSVQVDLTNFARKMDGYESTSSQTALHLSADTPRKRKLSSELREAEKSRTLDLKSVTKEDFLKLCEKFLGMLKHSPAFD